jgi:hypothetical protein
MAAFFMLWGGESIAMSVKSVVLHAIALARSTV